MKQDFDPSQLGIAVEQINIDQSHIDTPPDLESVAILPTKNLVLFPNVTLSVALRRPLSEKVAQHAYDNHQPVGVVCQIDPENESPTLSKGMYKVGVLADILKVIELPNGEKTVLVRGRGPFRILGAGRKTGQVPGSIVARIAMVEEIMPDFKSPEFLSILKNIKEHLRSMLPSLSDGFGHMIQGMLEADEPQLFVNLLLTNFPCEIKQKVKLLMQSNFMERTLGLLKIVLAKEDELNLSMAILRKVHSEMDDEQKRAFLHQQLVTIQEELYGDVADDLERLQQRAADTPLSLMARKTFDKEFAKLRRLNPQSPDYSVLFGYLEMMLELPWGRRSIINTDFQKAREVLDSEHFGLDKVKERILEQLAVIMHKPDGKAPIICLVGAPGVGKTSLGVSIANALGRNYARVSLGGLHDEAEIRGHRRTYVGAMPGRIIDAMKRAETVNPLLVLDEIDKIGADYKGDPAAALLEVLDPEQNCRFHDNYLDVDFDLSNVFFIATANTLSTVSQPLIDRMEVIDLSGYLEEEKREIARRHLLRRIFDDLSIEEGAFTITDDALNAVIEKYTNESGVRQLEKRLATISRKYILAKMSGATFPAEVRPEHLKDLLGLPSYNRDKYENNDYAGVVTGLAWTQTGGEILLVESSLSAGKGDRLTLTGNLGDVMKESATIALQWVKAHASQVGIDPALFEKYNLHLHFPEGAIPKDGPSAGITIATSIVSTFTQKRVRARLAMTGEITLRGKVLPVGGIKEKILAAKRAGITDIILSKENRKDIEDVAPQYIEGLTFHYVETVLDVMRIAITDEAVADALSL